MSATFSHALAACAARGQALAQELGQQE